MAGHLRTAPVHATSSQSPEVVNGTKTSDRLPKTLKALLSWLGEKCLEYLDIKDTQPDMVTNISPPEIEKCIQYAAWAWATYGRETYVSRDRVRNLGNYKFDGIGTLNDSLLDDSLVILSGSSILPIPLISDKPIMTDTQALVGLMDDGKGGVELVVAFRGSETREDWLTDFFIDLDPASELVASLTDKKCLVHAGFKTSINDFLKPGKEKNLYGTRDATRDDLKYFDSAIVKQQANKGIWWDKLPEEKRLKQEEKLALQLTGKVDTLKELALKLAKGKTISKVVCTGHSLGGALAQLAAFWFTQPELIVNEHDPTAKPKLGTVPIPSARVECFTYGAPRVGNPAFVDKWNEALYNNDHTCSYRVMHKHDPVPGVPFANLPIPLPHRPDLSTPYTHVEGGVMLCQPNIDPFQNKKGLPKQWPKPTKDTDGYQAQRRRRPINLDNTVRSDHGIDNWYIPALISALHNTA